MIDTLLMILSAMTIALCVAIAVIAILRPLVRRYGGAVATLRLWWIMPCALLVVLIPKHASIVWLKAPLLVQSATSSIAINTPATSFYPGWKQVALLTWLLGAIVSGAYLYRAQRRFSRSIKWDNAQRGLLPSGSGPAMVGAFRPRLVLPSDFKSRYSPLERKLIMLHERIHLRRRDGLANLAMSALLVLQWFNVALFWASRALCRDQECACDAIVMARHPQTLRAYANALLKTCPEVQYLPLVSRWQAYHPTVERIAMLKLHVQKNTRTKLATALLFAGGALASMVVYAGRPVADALAVVGAADQKYRISMALYQNGVEVSRPVVVAAQGKPFSIAVGDNEAKPGYRIKMVAAPHPSGIDIQAEIAMGAAQTDVSRPHLIVAPGKSSSIELSQPGGGIMRLDFVVDPLIADVVDLKRA